MPPSLSHLDLLIAAPSDPAAHISWGDLHFARGLQAGLQDLGISSRLLYRDSYLLSPPVLSESGLLVLRGKFAPSPSWLSKQHYRYRALWLISWPLDPTPEELSAYDHIFVASFYDSLRVARLSERPTSVLLQATAFAHFGLPMQSDGKLVFVGNTRGVHRPIVNAFCSAGVPLNLIGGGWDRYGIRASAEVVENQRLQEIYKKSLAVLNDHHRDMADLGYVNNRVYDALACGVPVITDAARDFPVEVKGGVIVHEAGADPRRTVELAGALRSQSCLFARIARVIRSEHSFTARARQLCEQWG